jgi:hypothetical protein
LRSPAGDEIVCAISIFEKRNEMKVSSGLDMGKWENGRIGEWGNGEMGK